MTKKKTSGRAVRLSALCTILALCCGSTAASATVYDFDMSLQNGGTLTGWFDYNGTAINNWDFTLPTNLPHSNGTDLTPGNSAVARISNVLFQFNGYAFIDAGIYYSTIVNLKFTSLLGSFDAASGNNSVLQGQVYPPPNDWVYLGFFKSGTISPEGVAATPLPPSAVLFSSSLLALGGWLFARRRRGGRPSRVTA